LFLALSEVFIEGCHGAMRVTRLTGLLSRGLLIGRRRCQRRRRKHVGWNQKLALNFFRWEGSVRSSMYIILFGLKDDFPRTLYLFA
jgi:hypothetical protein